MNALTTDRLVVRPPVETDRTRFVALFGDERFMEFADGPMDVGAANARFDGMLERAAEVPFAKQPIIERSNGLILGYTGVNRFEFGGEPRLEWGYRLIPEARGKGYATEAGRALMDVARRHFAGEILAMVDPRNMPSQRVITKLGFEFWKLAVVHGYLDRLYRITIP